MEKTIFKVANEISLPLHGREKERQRELRVQFELRNEYSISLKRMKKRNFSIRIIDRMVKLILNERERF